MFLARAVIGDKETQRGQETHDLLLPDLAGTADAVMGQSRQGALVDETRGRIELVEEHVEVQALQRGGGDEIAAARENAGGLRPPDRLAAAEGDERRAL